MPASSPLEYPDLRAIEKSLDDGNTVDAAARLGSWVHSDEHADAIDFLATRLLFQRGRIDSDGAADRLETILDRVEHFPEAEDWLHELEARTERTERSSLGPVGPSAAAAASPGDASTALTLPPTRPHEALTEPPRADTSTPLPPSHAPSIPRTIGTTHPYFDEATLDDDVTPAESQGQSPREDADTEGDDDVLIPSPSSSEPPPRRRRAARFSSEPATTPDIARGEFMASEPPTRPDVMRPDVMRGELQSGVPAGAAGDDRFSSDERPTRPSHMPFDNLRAKEQLSAEAGRYRGTSPSPDDPALGRRSRSPRAGRVSAAPPVLEQRIREAFERIVQGRRAEAVALLPEEPSPPDLRPPVRAALARALLEMGQAERAAAEATLALDQAPESSEARLAFVWSAVRYARQRDDAWCLERAARTLKGLRLNTGPGAALLDALSACIEARVGIPSVALRLAQQAVRADSESIDALAALAEAAGLCGEERRAEAALERLYALSESTAEQIAPRLRRLGVGELGPTSSASVWLPLEHTLSSGAREAALDGIEALADEELAGVPGRRVEASATHAKAVMRFFTLAPVFRHFGPYDGSLRSIERLEVALDLLYGAGSRALDIAGTSRALWQLSGLYLGETLRRCCDGTWHTSTELKDASLQVLGLELRPFQIVRHRIAHGRHAPLRAALEAVLALAPPPARQSRALLDLAPAAPWGDGQWPASEDLPRLGRALGHSVVAAFALEQGQLNLDRSSKSLTALDRYLELVAPADAPLVAESGWARWLSVFIGAYLGEVLCKELGGTWRTVDRPSAGVSSADAFVIELGTRQIAPLALVHAAVTGLKPLALALFVAELRESLEGPLRGSSRPLP